MDRQNLSNPDFEPSDADLQGLAHRAFADVPRENREALERLRREIEEARAKVRRDLRAHRRP